VTWRTVEKVEEAMKILTRCAMHVAIAALLTAGAANAGAPSSVMSTKPRGIQLVGTNAPNHPDPAGDATFIIRDPVPNVIPGARVRLDFSGCPQITICAYGQDPGIEVDCLKKTVTGTTDEIGAITFSILGRVEQANYVVYQDFPEPDPVSGQYLGCCTVIVSIPGFPPQVYPPLIAAAYDHEVINPGVGAGDVSRCLADILSGNYRERSDYDTLFGGGVLNAADLSRMLSVALAGGSTMSCSTPGVGPPCDP
jgi:hypothetical protein